MPKDEKQPMVLPRKCCITCNKEKPFSQEKELSCFYKKTNSPDGFQDMCKECMTEAAERHRRRKGIPKRAETEEFESTNISKKLVEEVGQAIQKAEQNPANPKDVEGFRTKGYIRPARSARVIPPRKLTKGERKISSTTKLKFYKGTFYAAYKNLRALDLSRETIAQLFGTKTSLLKYKEETDEKTEQAYQQAMSELESRLSRLILIRAYGYSYDEEKYISLKSKETGQWVEVRKEVVKKHQPGSDQLLIFYTTNLFPGKWKVSRELLTGKSEGYDSKPSERIRKVIESLGRDVLEQNTDRPEAEHSVSDGLTPIPVGSDKDDKK